MTEEERETYTNEIRDHIFRYLLSPQDIDISVVSGGCAKALLQFIHLCLMMHTMDKEDKVCLQLNLRNFINKLEHIIRELEE